LADANARKKIYALPVMISYIRKAIAAGEWEQLSFMPMKKVKRKQMSFTKKLQRVGLRRCQMYLPKGVIEVRITKVRNKQYEWVDIENALADPKFKEAFMKEFQRNMANILELTSKMTTAFYKRYKMKVECDMKIK
jgi:hypothetical protein